jgi:phosphoribosylaminoimidazole-succinocarboxamide synthase
MNQFNFPNQTSFYSGKVRNVYTIEEKYLVMVASDRISAFDVILPRLIPFKGQVLNQIAAYMLSKTTDICENWLIDAPAPNVSFGHKCEPFKIEMVIRGNLVGHAWRTYNSGNKILCGQTMPDGLKENDYFPTPLITPSTKASAGHDEDISEEEILKQGLATVSEWETLKEITFKLFERGRLLANKQGLILADTKYEFGKLGDRIVLMDEIHTPDSSRYFYQEGFEERQIRGERQLQLSKEFVREWLIQNNFMGKEGQVVPKMTEDWINTISARYIELYEKIIGENFVPITLSEEETEKRILATIKKTKDS